MPGQMVVYDPIARRLEDPVEVDLQQELSSPLVRDFRQLPSAPLIQEEIQRNHQVVAPNGDLDRAVRAAGAASIESATPDQFMQAFSSLVVRYQYDPRAVRTLVAGAIRARPDLSDRITAAAGHVRRVQGYGKDAKDYKEYKGKEVALPECPPFNQPVVPFIISPLTPQVNSPEQPPTPTPNGR
jgi:hypothetical protein